MCALSTTAVVDTHEFSLMRGLYAILDTAQCLDVYALAQVCLARGVRVLQLRAKQDSSATVFNLVQQLLALCLPYGAQLIINDRVDIALLCPVAGVHVGQSDLPVSEVRKLLPQAVIGLSTHSLQQVEEANQLPVDYIGFGPVFKTLSKLQAEPVCGVEGLYAAMQCSKHPVVAIGGIEVAHVPWLVSSGVQSVAMISSLVQYRQPNVAAIDTLLASFKCDEDTR